MPLSGLYSDLIRLWIIVVSALALSACFESNDQGDGPLFSDERNRYFVMEFVPKYTVAECTISFDLHLKKTGVQFNRLIGNTFQRYVSYREPTVGMMHVQHLGIRKYSKTPQQKNVVPFEVVFADQCDRKDAIFNSMVAYTLKRHGSIFDIQRVPFVESELKPEGFWIDDPNYDPTFWTMLHQAVRKDGQAFFQMAENLESNQLEMRHIYYALAEHYLPDGVHKKEAKMAKEKIQKGFDPEGRERQKSMLQDWVSKIDRYNKDELD